MVRKLAYADPDYSATCFLSCLSSCLPSLLQIFDTLMNVFGWWWWVVLVAECLTVLI